MKWHFKSTYQEWVKDGFDMLTVKLHGNRSSVDAQQEILNSVVQAVSDEITTHAAKRNPSKSDITAHKKTVQAIFDGGVDELIKHRRSKNDPLSREEQAGVTKLKEGLEGLMKKDAGPRGALSEFVKRSENHMLAKEGEAQKVNKLWGTVQDKQSDLAQLAPSGVEVPLSAEYRSEKLSPIHLPIAQGTGTELVQAINLMAETGRPPESFKNLPASDASKNLYNVMMTEWERCGHDKTAFVGVMKAEFAASNNFPKKWLDNLNGVTYLGAEERQSYKLTIRDGLVYQGDRLFDTSAMHSKNSQGLAAFVVDKDGNMYAGEHVGGGFHHSSFLSGNRAICAGMVRVENGRIINLDNTSGHYKPAEHNMVEGLKRVDGLAEAFELSDGKIKIHGSETQAKPESHREFFERATPLANEKWDGILRKEAEYTQKLYASLDKDILDVSRGKDELVGLSLEPRMHREVSDIAKGLKGVKEKSSDMHTPVPSSLSVEKESLSLS